MGLFMNRKGAVPELTANMQEPSQNQDMANQEFPVAAQSSGPTFPQVSSPPKAIPEVEQDPKPQMSIQASMPAPPIQQSPVEETPKSSISVTTELSVEKTESLDKPFFVRIDKFNETMDHFRKINDQVQNIETIINSLEMTRNEEEKEMEAWKKDVNDMKDHLNKIDKEIFSKI